MNSSKILKLESVDSTNNYALKYFDSIQKKTLVTAEEQTGGKGRRGKTWYSPKNTNLYASYIIKQTPFPTYKATWIGGLATLYTIREFTRLSDFWIKWPNDIYYNSKKIAGILSESHIQSSNKIDGVVLGIGLNVNMTSHDLNHIDKPATSILELTKTNGDITILSNLLLKNLNKFYSLAISKGINYIFEEWKKENALIGKTIEIFMNNDTTMSAKVLDIDTTGELIVSDKKAKIHKVFSGDISIKKF